MDRFRPYQATPPPAKPTGFVGGGYLQRTPLTDIGALTRPVTPMPIGNGTFMERPPRPARPSPPEELADDLMLPDPAPATPAPFTPLIDQAQGGMFGQFQAQQGTAPLSLPAQTGPMAAGEMMPMSPEEQRRDQQQRQLFPRATAFRDRLREARVKAAMPQPAQPQPPQLRK